MAYLEHRFATNLVTFLENSNCCIEIDCENPNAQIFIFVSQTDFLRIWLLLIRFHFLST